MAEACIVLYSSAVRTGNLETARRWNKTAINLRRNVGDWDGLVFELTMGAMAPFFLADYEDAKQMLVEALQVGRETRNTYSLGLALCFLGTICLVEGERIQALDYFSQHAALAVETNDVRHKTFSVYYLGWLLLKLGRYQPALQLIGALDVSNRYPMTVAIYEIPAVRDDIQQYSQSARQVLGEAEYNAAYAEGRLLSLDSAMAHGLQQAEAALQL
jgi:tetratricopeptide (TPR) repeat protein